MYLFKKLVKIISIFIIIIFTMAILFICFLKVQNSIRIKNLNNFSSLIMDYPLPNKTEFLEYKSAVGTLSGMGNHYSYCTILVVKSKLSKQQLDEFYLKNKFLPAEHKKTTKNITIDIIRATSPKLLFSKIDNIYPPLEFKSLSNINNFENYYFVVIIHGTYKTFESIDTKVVSVPKN